MPRPHIEFIQEQALAWEPAALPAGCGGASWKILSRDEAGGAFTALVRLDPGWRTAGSPAFAAAQELFVIDGELVASGGRRTARLGPGGYLRVGPGTLCGLQAASAACRLLWMADGRLDPAPAEAEALAVADSAAMAWQVPWVKGPAPGLRLKLLWRDETTGAYSRLLDVAPGWGEPRLEHHDCSEEAFMLSGDMTMGGLGTMGPGAYFFRPPGIKHGPMHSRAGAVIFIRTDGILVNHYSAPDGTPLTD